MEVYKFLFTFFIVKVSISEETESENEEEFDIKWLEHILPNSYTPNLPPSYIKSAFGESSNATEIKCSIIPKSITGISIKTMDFDVDLDVEVRWIDHRIVIPPNIPDNSTTTVPKKVTPKLWIPRISFRNCKLCDEFIFTRDNTLSLSPLTEEFSVEFRKVYKFVCSFDLTYYPFDYQICFIKIDALYTSNLVLLVNSMFEEDSTANGEVNLPPEFVLVTFNVTDQDCSIVKNTSHGTRSCLKYTFIFRRLIGNYIMLMYGPSIVIVTLSWVSFWLEVEATAPRVALALTSLLTLATQFSNAQNNVPMVASIKAIDVWMFACIVMVFASLVEYAFANYFHRLKKADRAAEQKITETEKKFVVAEEKERKCPLHCSIRTKIDSSPLDSFSRILFPLVFTSFNIFYWTYYGKAGVIE